MIRFLPRRLRACARSGAAAGLVGLLLAAPASAERAHDLGRFVVHYNAMATDSLSEGLARAHGIRRSTGLGILNVAVSSKQSDGARAVGAMIMAHVTDSRGHITKLHMREIVDNGAVYYIGEFTISAKETLEFNISVSPERTGPPYALHFKQQFMGAAE